MKKLMLTLMCLLLFTAAMATPAAACAGHRHHSRYARTGQSARYNNSRRAYYDYNTRHRSFWQKHRDKLTVAAGTGGGALLGGLIGGKNASKAAGLQNNLSLGRHKVSRRPYNEARLRRGERRRASF
ncbi:MAG: hypothetical protein LC754_07505 [Acidobacteria bacterium]|nr:hypothetical protein [Acidobacteriota bacterium]